MGSTRGDKQLGNRRKTGDEAHVRSLNCYAFLITLCIRSGGEHARARDADAYCKHDGLSRGTVQQRVSRFSSGTSLVLVVDKLYSKRVGIL